MPDKHDHTEILVQIAQDSAEAKIISQRTESKMVEGFKGLECTLGQQDKRIVVLEMEKRDKQIKLNLLRKLKPIGIAAASVVLGVLAGESTTFQGIVAAVWRAFGG